MDIDLNLITNFVPLLLSILVIKVAIIIVAQRLKLRSPQISNCWFCNENTKIENSKWWKCNSCHQYNGFTIDGDYNYEITEQRKQYLNDKKFNSYFSSIKPGSSNFINKNGLCKKCNSNEEKKLYELKSIDTDNWTESEIETCKINIEKKYRLCSECDRYVQQFLQKQSNWLMQYKMVFFKKKTYNFIVKNSGKLENFGRIFLTMLSGIVIYYHTFQPLPIFGALVQLIIIAKKINSNGIFDVLMTLIWLAIFGLMPIHNMKLYNLNIKYSLFTIEYLTGSQIITLLSAILGFFNVTSRTNSTINSNVSLKKLDCSMYDSLNSSPDSSMEIRGSAHHKNTYEELCSDNISPVNITHLLTSPNSSFNLQTTHIKSPRMSSNFRICDSQQGSSKNSQYHHEKLEQPGKEILSESMKNLSSLSLSSSNKKQTSRSPKIFETKTYRTTSPDLFKYNNSYNKLSGKKFILAPPKLKSVTQTSWVAGGYWQMGMDPPTLSRSSSQSSGFGSTGSTFEQSREPSVVNDVDKCSITSDTMTYCLPPQNMNPTISSCSHASSRLSDPCNSFTNLMPYCQQPQTIYHNYCYQNDFTVNRPIQDMPVCANNSNNSVPRNPAWFVALICGSIILNVIVLMR